VGTSVNQSSPKTLNWKAAHIGYRNPDVPVERVASEIWRAATNQPQGDLAKLLSAPIVARVGQLVTRAESALDASRATAIEIVRTKTSSLATDIARRAAVQAIRSPDRVAAYQQRLFAEATSYLVARDLPGFVGSARVRDITDSLKFKLAVANHVASVVEGIGAPRSLRPNIWKRHVQQVIKALQGKRK
jgi:hypothetical protein